MALCKDIDAYVSGAVTKQKHRPAITWPVANGAAEVAYKPEGLSQRTGPLLALHNREFKRVKVSPVAVLTAFQSLSGVVKNSSIHGQNRRVLIDF